MPRRTRPKPRIRQHGKDRKRGEGWHKRATSPGIKQASKWLLREAA